MCNVTKTNEKSLKVLKSTIFRCNMLLQQVTVTKNINVLQTFKQQEKGGYLWKEEKNRGLTDFWINTRISHYAFQQCP